MPDWLLFGLCLGAIQGLTVVAMAVMVSRFVRSKEQEYARRLVEAWEEFTTAPDENTPSKLAAYCDMVAMVLAGRLMQQVKTSMAGKLSGAARAEQGELAGVMAGGSPWLALGMALLPKKLQRQFLQNPQMLGALAGKLGGANGDNHAPAGENDGFDRTV